jgi:hypothetical protein
VRGPDIALGNGEEAGQPRFTGQKVVVVRIDPIEADVVANIEQPTALIEEQPEVHPECQHFGAGSYAA